MQKTINKKFNKPNKSTKPSGSIKPSGSTSLIEIRPGDGGREAARFAEELCEAFEAYLRKNSNTALKTKQGRGVITLATNMEHAKLVSYAGNHRVQRESGKNGGKGRRHTSNVTVAVMSKTMKKGINIETRDLTIEWYRGQGPGGQHRNTTDNALRLTDVHTGITVTADGRTRRSNMENAKCELRNQLQQKADKAQAETIQQTRRSQIGKNGNERTADYTWNWQRGQVKRHRDGRTWQLKNMLKGRFETGKN